MKMAAELKLNDSNNTLPKKIVKNNILPLNVQNNVEYYTFQISDVVIYTLSIFIFTANIITDVSVIVQCYLHGHTSWMYIMLSFLIIPIISAQTINVSLYKKSAFDYSSWIFHILCLGILQRHFILLKAAIKNMKGDISLKTKESVLQIQNAMYTISLIIAYFMDSPHLVVQMYIWTISNDFSPWTGVSIILSLSSIIWAIVINAKFILKITPQKQLPTISALTVEILWRSGFFISRIAALILCALCTKSWFFVLLGLHWFGMTVWLSIQKTHLRIRNWQECAYGCLMGMINCFDYMEFRNEDRSWFRTWIFYSVMMVENILILITHVIYYKDLYKSGIFIFYYTAVVSGTSLGLINMTLYNWKFKCTNNTKLCTCMTFKAFTDNSTENNPRELIKTSMASLHQSKDVSQSIAIPDEVTADKKSLLNNIVQNTDTMEKGIANCSFTISDELEISECKIINENEESASFSSLQRQKRRGICPLLEVDLEKDKINLDDLDVNFSSHKRRGICSLMQLCNESTNLSLEKHSEKVLNSKNAQSEGDQLNITENIPIKDELKLEISRENDEKSIETRSHISSIHDYENLCPLGVARPPWCIRSWKGYTDIETYIHDDSIVRDRRRDTLTSTATATTLSSEYSDATYTSFPFRKFLKRNRQDDYLDTLTYDLVDFESNLSNNEKLGNAMKEETSEPTLFMAKPVVIDDRGGMLSLDTILEEHEDVSPKKPTNSLVATIDKIRTQMAENSPRHIYYHRNESQWEDIEGRVSLKRTSLATVLFDNQYQEMSLTSKYNSPWRYSSASFTGCYNELDIIKEIYSHDKQTIPLIEAVLSDSPILGSRTDIKNTSIKESVDIADLCNFKEDNVYVDMSGGKIKKPDNIYETLEALISQTEAIPFSLEGDCNDDLAVPLESQFSFKSPKNESTLRKVADAKENDNESQYKLNLKMSPSEKVSPIEKQVITTRPRRKFSLLRERFEPKSDFPSYPTNHWSKTVPNDGGISIILSEQGVYDSAISQEKENLAKIEFTESCVNKGSDKSYKDSRGMLEIKEKRSIFLKQILSSPKFHGWSKKRTFSPNAKITQNS